jgi:eukaryotic-like serine/threonine-protein kinase
MPLSPGARLGPYEVTAHVGDGGMGEVYRARDTRLDRVVAIKVSKEAFSERFDREARAVATLNHPRICTLFDVGPDYLVMEYVDGSPLQGPVPLERALTYGAQICDALDAAHRKGITHRDLKPGNILVTKGGIKLLDFGLAKVDAGVLADEGAMTRAVTQQGQILGTLHYMSPEQLQGHDTGPSSDIFAFGLVLYEMLTGKRAFDGSSPASVIAAILERPAPTISDIAPPALDRTLRRCLEKDPDRRWQSAADLKEELEWIAADGGVSPAATTPAGRSIWPWAMAGVLTVALGIALWAPWRTTASVPRYTFSIAPSQGGRFLGGPVISPDGTRVAVRSDADGGRLEIHNLESGTSQVLAGVGAVAIASWSPDGRFLALFDQLELKRVDITDGRPVKIAEGPGVSGVPLVSWSKDGLILHSGRDGLYVVSASGGHGRKVTAAPPNARGLDSAPQFLPDGRHFLYWRLRPPARLTGTVFVGSIDSPPDQNNTVVLRDTSAAVFGRDAKGRAYLLYVRDDTLMAQAFDTAALKISGDPFVVASQIGMNGPVPGVSVSDTGVLAYTLDATGGRSIVQLAWFDRSGKRLADAGQPASYREFSLSPDESQVAVALTEKDATDIYLMDVKSAASRPMRFTFDPAQERSPVWSPDGTRVAFARLGKGIVEKQVGGTATERLLVEASGRPTDWFRDGRRVVYSLDEDIMLLIDGKPSVHRHTDFTEEYAHLSPDGSLLAYTSTDSRSVFDVYVETVPASDARWQISDGGFQPRWRSDGSELFYIRYADAMLMTVPVMRGPRFGAPTPLFRVDTVGLERGFAVSANGQRFLIQKMVTSTAAPITLTTKWAPER